MSRLNREEGIVGVEMTEEEVAELKAAKDKAEYISGDGVWTKRSDKAGCRPCSLNIYRIWPCFVAGPGIIHYAQASSPEPERVDLEVEDVMARSDMRIWTKRPGEKGFCTIGDATANGVELSNGVSKTYTELNLEGWHWVSDNAPCSKESNQ